LVSAAIGSIYYYFVYKPAHALPIDDAYVLPPKVLLVDTPAEVRIVVGSLQSGEHVGVLKRTRNWAEVRTRDKITGWVENANLLNSQTYERGEALLRNLLNQSALAEGHISGTVNVHLEPSREATQLTQLSENVKVQVYARRWVDRTPPPDQPSAPKVRDAWYLIRAKAHAGWVMGRFVALDPPEKLVSYAQGTNLVAWLVLKKVDDSGQEVPEYVAADRLGTQESDFTHIRVFTWWIKNHEYVTAYSESGLNGYFPIRVAEVNGVPYFRLRLIDDQGNKYQKVYGLFDTITRTMGTVQGWESDAMPPPREVHHRNPPKRAKRRA
jgi:uncharacterized protein YgiM (DUF1202 family)